MNKKMKHVLLALCVCIFGLMMTGCGSAINTTVKLTSTTKATCTIEQGYDDEMLDGLASLSEMTKKELINELKGSGAKYSKKKIDGVTYHMFSMTVKNKKLSDIEDLLSSAGYTNVCLTKDFFYATLDPSTASSNLTIAKLADAAQLQKNDLTDSLSFYMNVKVSFKNKVKTTNGKLSNKSKTVSWTIRDASKKKNFYASTSKVTKTAKTTAVKNNKSYKAGKKITVSNSKSLVKMKLDGKVVKKNAVIKKKGTHTLTIWSKNGKVQNVTFTIK